MIYLLHENNEINEIKTIYYIKPDFDCFYKEVKEEDLPKEKEGHYRRLYYNKTEDTVTAEYIPIPPTEEELLREELDQTKLELSTAITELADMILAEQVKNV